MASLAPERPDLQPASPPGAAEGPERGRAPHRSGRGPALLIALHVLALTVAGGYLIPRWYDTLYHLRGDGRAEPVLAAALIAWPLVLVVLGAAWLRRASAGWPLLLVTAWAALAGTGIALFERSLLEPPVVAVEGAPLDPDAPPPGWVTEERNPPVDYYYMWQPAALPGQTFVWEGFAVRLADYEIAAAVDGLPPPPEAGFYLLFTLEAAARGPFAEGWPGERSAVEVSIDKVRTVRRTGWTAGAPADPQLPGWLDVDGEWVAYAYTDISPQLPIPAPGETVTRRFAAFVPAIDPVIGEYEDLFVVVRPDVEFTCYMRPPDVERRCTWLLFAWEIPNPTRDEDA